MDTLAIGKLRKNKPVGLLQCNVDGLNWSARWLLGASQLPQNVSGPIDLNDRKGNIFPHCDDLMAVIEFIYFDLGNVIMNFDHKIGFRRVAEMGGIPSEAVRAALFDTGLAAKYESGLVDCDQFHDEFCQLTDGQLSKNELLLGISDIFSPNLAVFPLIAQLKASGFPFGILSNTCKAHWDFLQSRFLILREFSEPHILSYEAKSMKPDRVIYECAIERAGCEANLCFFVDDKPENVGGAKAAGIDAVLYRSVPELAEELRKREVSVNF
jgi:putative hydrolase of the HAD superfamily